MIKEGSFTVIRADQRQGKTLTMSIYALQAFQAQRRVFTNIEYTFEHTPLYFQELDLNDSETTSAIRGSMITLDEMWMIIDSRSSMSPTTKKFSRWLYQVKKQGVDLVGTTHKIDLLDKRARENFDVLIDVQALPKNRPEDEAPQALHLHFQNGPLRSPFSRKAILPVHPTWLGLYDSGNVFDPLEPPPDYEPKVKPTSGTNGNGKGPEPPWHKKPEPFSL